METFTEESFQAWKKTSKHVDCIVIGSGVGGLTCASLLAQAGVTVVVLERAQQSGGATHGFTESGFKFEMGLQEVGSEIWKGLDSREPFAHVLAAATNNGVEWNLIPRESYHVCIGDSEDVPVRATWAEWREDLAARFPAEADAIDRFHSLVQETRRLAVGWMFSHLPVTAGSGLGAEPRKSSGAGSLLSKFVSGLHVSSPAHSTAQECARDAKAFLDLARKTVEETLGELTQDAKLRYHLTFLWAKCGLPPHVASWGAFALVVGQFLDGVAYPTGGAPSIDRVLVDIIHAHGGRVFVNARVASIACEKGKCVGVTMEDGRVIHSAKVISAIGASNTYERLIPAHMHDVVRQPILAIKDLKWSSYAILQVFFGFDGDAKSLGLSQAGYWFLPGDGRYDHSENTVNYLLDTSFSVDFPYVQVSFPSAKDPSLPQSTAVVLAAAHYEWFRTMTPDDVQAVAEKITSRLSAKMYQRFPQLKSKATFVELATPLAHEFHLGASRGAPLGLGHTPSRFEQAWLRPQTPIPNLVLAGQDVFVCGVVNASVGGFMGAATAFPTEVMGKFAKLFATHL